MLAEGGVVTAPTLAMIGEGGQSEAVIPLDRLHEFGGGGRVEVYGRISGSDILLSNERAQRNRTRSRGF
jgi:SLT domain-containing protein